YPPGRVNVRLAWSRPGGRFCRAAVAVTAAIALLAACSGGGSGRLSKPEYVRRAEAICRRLNKKAGAVPEPDQHEPTSQAKAIGEIAKIQRAGVDELRRLRPPEADQATIDKWLGLVDQTIDQLQAVRAALKAGDGVTITRADDKGRALSAQADKIARGYGLDQCSATESP
ncbi:MAG TPA: hypothetical protein VHP57_08270, partial [Acidimicrobiia bacterium]|nr:hypothetical protein [Acidimicrobiia bacterium]